MRMRTSVRLLASAALGLLLAAPASAVLVDSGNEMVDQGTGLIWLDLTETLGDSINTALTNNPSYTLATTDQVAEMFTNAGFTDIGGLATVADRPAAEFLIDSLGCTASDIVCAGLNAYGRGFAAIGGGFYAPSYRISSVPANSGDAVVLSLFSTDPTVGVGDRGVYLVRPIPEPGTALMLGLGLVGLALRGRR